jgi:four helix bundle protein
MSKQFPGHIHRHSSSTTCHWCNVASNNQKQVPFCDVQQIDLKYRTFQLAVSIGKLVSDLPNSVANRAYANQIIRSSASVGANFRAAGRAKSTADFINKLKIVEEEADETIYFLELLLASNPSSTQQIAFLVDEATQILKMVVASIVKARAK